MEKIAVSPRTRTIEAKWDQALIDLLYSWHWKENLKHAEIATRVGVPRPTVTRWFQNFHVPTQSATRFTNLNLLNVGFRKTKPAKLKVHKVRPWKVHDEFFHRWSNDMAYVLGFFCADGSMFVNPRGSRYIQFNITDKDLLLKIKDLLGSGHKLSLKKRLRENERWKPSWSIQIGSRKFFDRLITLGITQKKARRLRIPKVPQKYLADFVRGYFDGDGGVWFGFVHKTDRETPTKSLITTFTSCSEGMLQDIASVISRFGKARLKKPIFYARAFRLHYSTADSRKIYHFMYTDGTTLHLERKKVIFEKYLRT